MRIGIDARCLNTAHLRGMGKYVRNLLAAADQLGDVEWQLYAERPDLPFHVPPLERATAQRFEIPGWRIQSWEQWALPRRAKHDRVDVLHCTGTTLPWWQPVPTVVTLHDTIPWEETVTQQGWYWNRVLPRAYSKCAAIIAPSQSARDDIARRWPVAKEKIYVIPHGVDDCWFEYRPSPLPDSLVDAGVRPPYFLYFGGEIPRKRLHWAIQMFERLAEPDLQLVACGIAEEAKADILKRLPGKIRSRVCLPPFILEENLPSLVHHAIALIYPTLYEGFGFPALEAQAVGTPVLFSPLGSLAELQGPGAIVLPPDDLVAWVRACQELLANRRQETSIDEAARLWARQFTWRKSAERHREVYQRAAENESGERAEIDMVGIGAS